METELYAVRGPGPQGMVAWPPPRHAAVMPQMQVAPSAGGAGAHTTAMSSSNSAVAAAGPPQLPARQLPTAAAAHPPGGLAQQFAGGMKLALSERERAARTHVVLPYEHRGHGTQGGGSSAVDWRDALPRAAGGRSASAAHAPEARTPPAAATGGLDGSSIAGAAAAAAAARADGPGAAPRQTPAVPLGEVHYVRDTDSECDSFEDPDDDLDI